MSHAHAWFCELLVIFYFWPFLRTFTGNYVTIFLGVAGRQILPHGSNPQLGMKATTLNLFLGLGFPAKKDEETKKVKAFFC